MPPSVVNLSVPAATAVAKTVSWEVSTAAPGIEDGVALKAGEETTAGDLCKPEGMDSDAVRGVDGNATVNSEVGDGNGEAEDGEGEESSSAEEGNDEGESNPDDDDSSLSDDGENCIAEVKAHVPMEDTSIIRLVGLFNEMHTP